MVFPNENQPTATPSSSTLVDEPSEPGSGRGMPRRTKHSVACDRCRRRKLGCDAGDMPDYRCSNCSTASVECQYRPTKKMRRPTKGYVEALEERVKNMEHLIREIQSNPQLSEQPEEPTDIRGIPSMDRPPAPSGVMSHSSRMELQRRRTVFALLNSESEDLDPSDDEDDRLVKSNTMFYHGKSSSKNLVLSVLDLKGKGRVPMTKRCAPLDFQAPILAGPRLPPHTDFPDPDLMNELINCYFENWNLYLPLLHRPSFEQNVRLGLHYRERSFGGIVLLVCAIGSTWVADPRIPVPTPVKARGFHWFEQVAYEPWSMLARPKLHDLQICVLLAAYLTGSSSGQGDWTTLSLGLRMALDLGLHRKKTYSSIPATEQELWRRAFWILLAMDRMTSFVLGRPCCIHDEDFDVDPMTEVDDEYWSSPDPALAFKQPPGKPSKIAFANHLMRIFKILAFASRTIYTINKSKLLFGFVGTEWKQSVVAELDSALNKWLSAVPAHLRWDPNMEDETFFSQSACLYLSYYNTQISVHRQFLPSSRNDPAPPLPSRTICTTAARSAANVLWAQHTRTGLLNLAINTIKLPLCTACIVLLINIWLGQCTEREKQSCREDIERLMTILRDMEVRHLASRKIR
ncbi:fungal-specific transcription factor domain-containing protein [Earliella scabrosa]|nr:fungal-specific transcription factor domain-containing protein [Earliella scabrosa]